jgi:ribosomal protein S18 acetylase RimI-like enzyme
MTTKAMPPIIPYDEARDAGAVAALWGGALGAAWPINAGTLRAILACPMRAQQPGHFVAREGDDLVGFVGTQLEINGVTGRRSGYIMLIMVAPSAQRRGIGRRLLDRAVGHLRANKAAHIQIGGKNPRIWPGVPGNLAGGQYGGAAMKFFRACGWQFDDERVYDLARSLTEYELPQAIRDRMAADAVYIAPATPADVPDVLAMNRREFAGWSDRYVHLADIGDYADMLVARAPGVGVVGSLVLYGPNSSPARADCPWKTLLGPKAGALNEVGVAEHARGRGIGLALVGYGSQVLKERGVGNAFIGWTTLVDFYGQLGYAVWKDYSVASRAFNNS